MKIAIHKSSWGFSRYWISYCEKNNIEYKIVNCYDTGIVQQLSDCDALMWHFHHLIVKDYLFAKQLLFSVQQSGKLVFPDFNTAWHFDDKLGQKYLLESVGAPMAATWAFYDKRVALSWVANTDFPKVFKLRGGAGSTNVKLVKNREQAIRLINKAFGRGIPKYSKTGELKEQITRFAFKRKSLIDFAKSIIRFFTSTEYARATGNDKGYILFQEFIKNNKHDIRVVVIGNKAFAIKRLVRENDFRASGSGFIIYDKSEFDESYIRIAFDVADRLNTQCVAYDFVVDESQNPLIVEINYGFAIEGYFPCPGYWDKNLIWHEEKFNAAEWMIEEIINAYKRVK